MGQGPEANKNPIKWKGIWLYMILIVNVTCIVLKQCPRQFSKPGIHFFKTANFQTGLKISHFNLLSSSSRLINRQKIE